jgi:tRNA dimethylallyltransferase
VPPAIPSVSEPLHVLLGATASGKEAAAVAAAPILEAEIVCADSAKPYRGLDVASAAAPPAHAAAVPHHLVGVLDPTERLSAARWTEMALAACDEIRARGRRPLVVGGTALYLKTLLFGIFAGPAADPDLRARLRAEEAAAPGTLHERLARVDPTSAARLHRNDVKRVLRALEVFETTGRPISELQQDWAKGPRTPYVAVGLRRDPKDLRRRIDARVARMAAAGLFDEVRALLAPGRLGPSASEVIGVKELLPVLRREAETGVRDDAGRAAALAEVRQHTWILARRQATWWKSFPGVRWLDVPADEPSEQTGLRVADALRELEG